ncbi:MAG: hypothetical protein EOO58_03835 [Hymenobacter sp.]|nr:MAG: hypothetical protein EOO58_03835 [Hymenobacter sp.]
MAQLQCTYIHHDGPPVLGLNQVPIARHVAHTIGDRVVDVAIRKVAYQASQKFRTEKNGTPLVEPKDISGF